MNFLLSFDERYLGARHDSYEVIRSIVTYFDFPYGMCSQRTDMSSKISSICFELSAGSAKWNPRMSGD